MKTQTLPQATLRILLAAAVALGTAMSAQAADRQWDATKVGGSEDSPYDIWTTANWNGAVGSGNHLHFAVSEKTYIKSTSNTQVGNDFDVDSGDFVFIGPLYFLCYKSNQANATSSVVKKGDWTIQDYGMRLGSSSGTTVTFTNESGNVSITGGRNNDSILSVASGANSTVTVVKEAGDWSVSKTFFIGNGAGSTGRFYNRGGNISGAALYGVCLGSGSGAARSAYLEISGGRITNTGGHLTIGDGDNPGTSTVYVTGNGEYLVQAGYVRLGKSGASTLTIDQNGLVTASENGVRFCFNAECGAGRDCFLNLNGGTLATKTVDYGSGSAAATFTFNGGTLKATAGGTLIAAHNNLSVVATATGGAIDADLYDVTVASDIGNAAGATGTMTFKGNGIDATVRLTGAVNYTGMTYLNSRTHLVVKDEATKNAILARGLTIVKPTDVSAKGTYTLLSIADGTACTSADLSSITLGAGLEGATLSIVDGAITIGVTKTTQNWSGAANTSLAWGGANWDGGDAWEDGNDAVFAADGAIANLDAAAEAYSVTFNGNTAVTGSAALTVPTIIDVASGKTASISAPVAGAFTKTGTGTLELSQNRTEDATVLSDGTLKISGDGTTIDWNKLTFGTDAAKPVTLHLASGADIANKPNPMQLPNVADRSVTLVKDSGDWDYGYSTFTLCNAANTTAKFIQNGGTLTCGYYFVIGDDASGNSAAFEVNGGTITYNRDVAANYVSIGGKCPGSMKVSGSGSAFNTTRCYIRVGVDAPGTLTVENGGVVTISNNVAMCGSAAAAGTSINLKSGGTLVTDQVNHGNNDAAATLAFDGGILKAHKDNNTLIDTSYPFAVTVTANGGTIDADGKNVTVKATISDDSASMGGGMTFKGGGKITLAAGNTYTGATTVEIGTTVVIPEPSAILGDLAVTVPETAPADGVYSLLSISGEGTFPASVLDGVVAPSGSRLALSSDSKSVLCVYGNPDPTWIGGASGSLSVGANWSTGVVPTSGNCIIGNATAANLTVGDTFAATSITFPADTALVTIGGADAISGIEAITNLSSLHHVFNCPVVCADGITPSITLGSSNYMTFAGGITMYNAPKTGGSVKDHWSGNVTITTDARQTYTTGGNAAWFAPGTTYFAKLGCFDRVQIAEGATAVVERLVYDNCVRSAASGGKTGWFNLLFDNGNGTIRTKEVKTSGDAVLFHSYADSDMVGGTIIAEKLTCGATVQTGGGFPYPVFMLNCGALSGGGVSTDDFNGEGVWVIGPGGLAIPEGAHGRAHFETSLGKSLGGRPAATLHSYADWTLMPHPNGRNVCALQIGSGNGGFLVIDTGHYAIGDAEYDSATSHTVTLDGMVTTGPMRVEGNGTVVFANEYNTFSGLTVTDTATVKVNAGCTPGSGDITLGAGTKLTLTATSNTFTPIANTLNLPTTGAATIRIDGARLKSGDQVIATVGNEATTDNVALDLAGTALVGRRASLRVEDGKLVLNIIFPGTLIIVR